MTAQREVIARLLSEVQEAGTSYLHGDQSTKISLLQKISVLQREIEGPAAYVSRMRLSPLLNMCVLMATEMGLFDAVVKKCGESVDACILAHDLHQDEFLIERIMRLLTVNGICDEVGVRLYRSNAIAELLNTPGQVGGMRNMVDLLFPIGGKLIPLLRETSKAEALHEDLQCPFRYTYGTSMFEYFERDAEHKEAFDLWMSSRRAGMKREWFDLYPIKSRLIEGSSQSSGSVFLVDVAGGKGHDILSLNSRFSNLPGRLVLQDLPQTLESVASRNEIEVMPHDLFAKQPIKGARAYFFRAVFHDWPDPQSRDILANTAKAMKPGYSRLLIEDLVLPDRGADLRHSAVDFLMYMMPGGVERTLSAWKELLDSAGLQIVKIWRDEYGQEPVIEAELKEPEELISNV